MDPSNNSPGTDKKKKNKVTERFTERIRRMSVDQSEDDDLGRGVATRLRRVSQDFLDMNVEIGENDIKEEVEEEMRQWEEEKKQKHELRKKKREERRKQQEEAQAKLPKIEEEGEKKSGIKPDAKPLPKSTPKSGARLGIPDDRRNERSFTIAAEAPVSHFFLETPVSRKVSRPEVPKVPKTPQDTIKNMLASRPISDLPVPEARKLTIAETFEQDGTVRINVLKEHLLREGRVETNVAVLIFERAAELLKKEPNLLELTPPLIVCGDIHGQFYDFVSLLEKAGDPHNTNYLFLGDYVDRGCFSCETVLLLFAIKVNFPKTFHLLRGNHESRVMTDFFNFKLECEYKYDELMYNSCMYAFDCLPLAAHLITPYGNFLCVHGGLSPDIETLEDIQDINRFSEPPDDGPFCDLIWSDPVEEDSAAGLNEEELEDWYNMEYELNPTRGCGYLFGYLGVVEFLEQNNLVCIVRAHEVQKEGFLLHKFGRDDLPGPLVITVFSAPNYCDMYENLAAFIDFQDDGYDFGQLSWVSHPYYLPDYMDGINYTLPYVLEFLTKMCAFFLDSLEDEILDEEEEQLAPEQVAKVQNKLRNTKTLSILMRKLREEREEVLQANNPDLNQVIGQSVSKFARALKLDGKNEKRPRIWYRRRNTF